LTRIFSFFSGEFDLIEKRRESVLTGMAKSKTVLDWFGNPPPTKYGIGICVSDSRLF
jgi:hypothetical protein